MAELFRVWAAERVYLLKFVFLWVTASAGWACGVDESSREPESSTVPGRVVFVDATEEAGLMYLQGEHRRPPDCILDAPAVGREGHYCTPEWYAGGVAAADYNDDGHVDLYVTRIYGPDMLFRNDGNGHFEDVAHQAGLSLDRHSSGVAFADVDNDGDADLYVTSIGGFGHALFINDGGGHFVDEATARGAAIVTPEVHMGTSVAVGDYDLDGYLDLYVGEHRTDVALGEGRSHSRLLHNRGAEAPGYFEDVTEAAGVSIEDVYLTTGNPNQIAGVFSLAPAFSDLDDDGFPDLLITSDFGCSRLFWNRGDGTFLDGTQASGVGLDENGMGSTLGDFDGDGDLDWFVTSISGYAGKTGNRLYRNDGGRKFADASDFAGVREGFWGWGTVFLDYDNDTDLDLVMTNGWNAAENLFDPMRFWVNSGRGVMIELSQDLGVTDDRQGRGLIRFDPDEDGDLDIFVAHHAQTGVLYRNDNQSGHGWLSVRVRGTQSNRDGYGARVRVRVYTQGPEQFREIGAVSHYLGHSEPIAHFGLGLGDSPVAVVEVDWPASGEHQVFHNVARDQVLEVVEPQ